MYLLIYLGISVLVFIITTIINGILFKKKKFFNSANLGGSDGIPIIIFALAFPISLGIGLLAIIAAITMFIIENIDNKNTNILRTIGDKLSFYNREADHLLCNFCKDSQEIGPNKSYKDYNWVKEGSFYYCESHSNKEIRYIKAEEEHTCKSCLKKYESGDNGSIIFFNDRGLYLVFCAECVQYYIHNIKKIKYDCLE